jgi:putative transposase
MCSVEIKTTRHTVYLIAYHLVWVTKYRRSILTTEMQMKLKEILQQTAAEHSYDLMEVEARQEHVHCFVSAPPKIAPSEIVKILKGASARRMFLAFPQLKIRMNKGHLWHPSSYIGTAGNVSAETIKRYIEQQWSRG